jgi:cytochrome c-type biogenesis protein CcmH/NrfG
MNSASLGLGSYTEAVQDYQRAHKLAPNDAMVKRKLAEARRLADEERKKQVKRFARLFADDESQGTAGRGATASQPGDA